MSDASSTSGSSDLSEGPAVLRLLGFEEPPELSQLDQMSLRFVRTDRKFWLTRMAVRALLPKPLMSDEKCDTFAARATGTMRIGIGYLADYWDKKHRADDVKEVIGTEQRDKFADIVKRYYEVLSRMKEEEHRHQKIMAEIYEDLKSTSDPVVQFFKINGVRVEDQDIL